MTCFWAICISSPGKYLFVYLCSFFYLSEEVLYILWISITFLLYVLKIPFSVQVLSFYYINGVLSDVQLSLILMKVTSARFSFTDRSSGSCLRKSFLLQSNIFSFSKSFQVLPLHYILWNDIICMV